MSHRTKNHCSLRDNFSEFRDKSQFLTYWYCKFHPNGTEVEVHLIIGKR